jgi:glucosamine--fructose-6-phosphate aminotransferase (isomerizing)
MCGIVGYIGNENAVPFLISGLQKLEYRGYDSSGIAIWNKNGLDVVKCKGRIKELEEKVSITANYGKLGIGHTRWATHGEPSDINSHPHQSYTGKIAVVHNGIIENYIVLKEFLIAKGYEFVSDTDTEVLAHLLDYHYKDSLLHAVIKTIQEIEGSYALAVVASDKEDEFIAVRKESPLIVGLGKDENYIASDIPAILDKTRDIIILDDKDIVCVKKDEIKLFNEFGMPIEKDVFHVNWDVDAAEKSGYEHFMMKEMCEEPKVVKDTISPRIIDGKIKLDDVTLTKEYLDNIDKIYIVACGTASHAGIVAKYLIERFGRISVEVDVASEFRYRNPIITDKTLTIIISQSGETIDTLFALREAKSKGSRILSIVNVVGSTIARESDEVIYTWAGPEIAVASTKAYNTQLSVLYLIAIDIGLKRGTLKKERADELIKGLMEIPALLEKILSTKEDIQKFSSEHFNSSSVFFIGRGLDYALSMEGSLKLKEISYIHSEAYAGGELKHGTIALIEEGTLVVCPMTQNSLMEKMLSNIQEVKSRGATIMAITSESNKNVVDAADIVITIPDIDPVLAPLIAITPMQLFAYYTSVQKGCDVDKPRNLAKSVTVE